MNVWIVVDDCPQDFGNKEIIGVFASRRLAEYFRDNAKGRNPYKHQYFVVQMHKIKDTVKMGG